MQQESNSTDVDLFISYASRDRDRVLEIAGRLESAGIRLWIDRHKIEGGTNYGPEIVRGIRGCKVFMLICSNASLRSRNVKQEIQLAWKYERPYLPLLLEPVSFPEQVEYWLEGCSGSKCWACPPSSGCHRSCGRWHRPGFKAPR